jgi:outer membrane protein assembly factor BamD
MKKILFLKWFVFLTLTGFLLSGCSGKAKDVKTVEGDPETLYKEGLSLFNKRDYYDALKKFETLKANFPDSPPFTLWAELKIADCHFFRKEYVEAVAAYEEFKKIHPTHEDISYVQYQIGMSYFNQMLTPDRDQTFTKKALSNFEYLIANYPPGLFTEKAKDGIRTCRERLADHEFYIGNFYYKKGKYPAAVVRFEGLLEKFPRRSEEDKTLFFLGKSYLELGERDRAREAFTKIVQGYPTGLYSKEAKAILERRAAGKVSDNTKGKDSGDTSERGAERVPLIKFDEEGKKPALFHQEKEAEWKLKERVSAPPPPSKVDGSEKVSLLPGKEGPKDAPSQAKPKINLTPGEEKRAPAPAVASMIPKDIEKPKGEALLQPGQAKGKPKGDSLLQPSQAKLVDRGLPIDITSDRVESISKENLIVFKGNVIARQKDLVIYADSVEAVILDDGKGIEKVTAGGNVKVQQGLRLANCQQAVFYNLDQKVVMKGDSKVWEGDTFVSGDEIVFDIEKNRFEVKGGEGGRGKAKIHQ